MINCITQTYCKKQLSKIFSTNYHRVKYISVLLLAMLTTTMGMGIETTIAQEVNKETLMESDLIINTFNRQATSLDGTWDIIIDPYQTGY